MKKISCDLFGDVLIKQGIINSENKELYVYGLRQGLIMLLNIMTAFILGCIMGMAWESLAYYFAYVPIRTFAGGFHANTQTRCYLSSVILVTVVLLTMKYVLWTPFICCLGILIGGFFILLLAPIEDKNKPFTKAEQRVFKKKTRMLLFIEVVVGFALAALGFLMASACVVMSLNTLALMLILGVRKNHIKE